VFFRIFILYFVNHLRLCGGRERGEEREGKGRMGVDPTKFGRKLTFPAGRPNKVPAAIKINIL